MGQVEEKKAFPANSSSSMNLAELSLIDCIKAFTEKEDSKTELLIILDQFEEYFLYHSIGDEFLEQFSQAVNHPNLRVNFLIGLREDGLAKLDLFKGHIPTLFSNYLRLRHLNYDAAYEAIENPIAQYNNLLPENEPPFSIEDSRKDSFVAKIIAEVESGRIVLEGAGRGGPDRDNKVDYNKDEAQVETPYLQLVMTRLWYEEVAANSRIIRLKTFNRLGGADGIAKSHLNRIMQKLLPEERNLCARFFHYLVTPSGTKIAHGPLDLAEYLKLKAVTPEEKIEKIRPVLDKLVSGNMRILRPTVGEKYEIFHDALAKAILSWQTRYERARKRKRNSWFALAAFIFLLIPIFMFIQYRATVEARKERDRAITAEADARAQKEVAEKERDRAEKAEGELKEIADATLAQHLSTQGILAAKTPNPADGFFDSAALLTVQGIKIKKDYESRSGALRALQSIPHLSKTLWGHSSVVRNVAFSPDGTRVVSGSSDDTVIIWDAETGKPIGEPWEGHRDWVSSVAFSPDGKQVVSGSSDDPNYRWDYMIFIWDVDEESWIQRLCRIAGRNFTQAEWQNYLDGRPYERTCPQYPAGS